MSISTDGKILWAELLNKNKPLVAEVVAEALKMCPDYPSGVLDRDSISMIAMRKKGFEEALTAIFATIPGDRTVPNESKFMDMTQ
ncbi:MAG: hypothetical protein PHV93_05085 [Candidatus Pacebacteria bacterium]|nr:hypothetical protein [Candidatus Paceibacterota bacterium]